MRTTPNVPSKLRQSLIIWRYRGSKTWSGSVAPGKRTVPSGNIAKRRGASDALGTKCLYQNVQPASERVAPDVADELRRDHFTVLRQAIAETGGTEVAFRLSGFPEVVSVVAVN
jgi:hypothetical protein